MIKLIPAGERHFSDFGWLKTYWLFSFSNYYDPENIQFGALRVFNDDVVLPGKGFPTHPHNEMEIITIVLDGEITHEDSMGNRNVISAGDVQRMTAGTGITHSEFNLSERPVHFYQVWIYPDQRGLEPSYDQRSYSRELWENRFFPVASGQIASNVVTFHTDATIYRASLEKGKDITFPTSDMRRIFVYLTTGAVNINGTYIHEKDQARIDEEALLCFSPGKDSELILIDVPSCKGWGYDTKTLRGDTSK
ncbi:MAG TPA: pirin family protein [Synergistales bacterium]|nr:pirin family protein [Synergistales bacterium]